MASSAPLALQWALNSTVGGSFQVAQELLQAATTDNVQVLALMACEKLGMTLPLCVATRVKIERLARPPETSEVLKYIQARIGWHRGDATEYLSRNEGGIRFLCLATILCALDSFKAAQVIEGLLQASSAGDEKRPSLPQLKTLVSILKPKLMHSSFLNTMSGWERVLPEQYGLVTEHNINAPGVTETQQLIRALSESNRIGSPSIVIVKASPSLIAWSMAVVNWFLGQSPDLYIYDRRTPRASPRPPYQQIIRNSSTRVTILEWSRGHDIGPRSYWSRSESFLVEVQHRILSIEQLLCSHPSPPLHVPLQVSGLVDVKTWVSRCLIHLSHGICDKPEKIQDTNTVCTAKLVMFACYRLAQVLKDYHKRAFDSDASRGAGLPFLDTFEAFVGRLLDQPASESEAFEAHLYKLRVDFVVEYANFVADLLCLSLFGPYTDSAEFPKLPYRHRRVPLLANAKKLLAVACAVVKGLYLSKTTQHLVSNTGDSLDVFRGGSPEVDAVIALDIMRHAFELLGYKHTPAHEGSSREIVMISECGQVAYPSILQMPVASQNDFMGMSCFPGNLIHHEVCYKAVRTMWGEQISSSRELFLGEATPFEDWNMLSQPDLNVRIRMAWRVAVEDELLDVGIALSETRGATVVDSLKPPLCLPLSHLRCSFTKLCDCQELDRKPPSKIGIVGGALDLSKDIWSLNYRCLLFLTGRSAEIQLLVMASIAKSCADERKILVHQHGCLDCALRRALDEGIAAVIS